MKQKILYTNGISDAVNSLVSEMSPSSTLIVTDSNVDAKVLPSLSLDYPVAVTEPGDMAKNLESLAGIWKALIDNEATRRSLIINIGGGVVTDMGGFAAATFKRGIRFINVPTTLLSAVDAAVGGKTGINFEGYKNEIGAFAPADAVVISTSTFSTLPAEEMLSGYAEMLKHGLLSGAESYRRLLDFDILHAPLSELLPLLEESVKVKERIVEEDPREKGLRRALNLGHTVGHAFESLALERNRPVPHGYAVAWGMLVEMILSHMQLGFPSAELYRYAGFMKSNGYGTPGITCDDYPLLLELMHHDKKNETRGIINFTLLSAPGEIRIDRSATEEQIKETLDIFRDLME